MSGAYLVIKMLWSVLISKVHNTKQKTFGCVTWVLTSKKMYKLNF